MSIELSPEPCQCAVCERYMRPGTPRFTEPIFEADDATIRALRYARTPRRRDDGSGDDDYGPSSYGATGTKLKKAARYYHLACLAERQPDRLRSALAACELPLDNRAELEAQVRAVLERFDHVVDLAEEAAETRETYREYIHKLVEAPDDDLLCVFGDWLETVEDPRGQLVATQRALETAEGSQRTRLQDAERALFSKHRRQFLPDSRNASFTWRRGFIHHATFFEIEPMRIGDVMRHASMQLVNHLVVPSSVGEPPRSVRVLEVTRAWPRDALGELVARLPHLARLRVSLEARLDELAHAALAEIELTTRDAADRERIRLLDSSRLPALRGLALRGPRNLDLVLEGLASTPLPLRRLALSGDVSLGAIELVASRFELDELDLRELSIRDCDRDRLAALARTVLLPELVVPAPVPEKKVKTGPWIVRHVKRPEWGTGRVIEELDGALRIDFAVAGEKLIRNPELVEDID